MIRKGGAGHVRHRPTQKEEGDVAIPFPGSLSRRPQLAGAAGWCVVAGAVSVGTGNPGSATGAAGVVASVAGAAGVVASVVGVVAGVVASTGTGRSEALWF